MGIISWFNRIAGFHNGKVESLPTVAEDITFREVFSAVTQTISTIFVYSNVKLSGVCARGHEGTGARLC